MQEIISEEKRKYFELYRFYKRRLKNKRFTAETYNFERSSAAQLTNAARDICEKDWNVKGYHQFRIYHPQRMINAPYYIDRIVEQWFVENYIQPAFMPDIYDFNMACIKNKGPFLTMDYVKSAMTEIYNMYAGTDWWVFQFDMQGYFDNISHDAALRIIKEKVDPEMNWMYEKIVNSYTHTEGYAALNEPKARFGFPKGNLPSQWTGIIMLNELDLKIHAMSDCLFNIRYMDDGLNFFKMKEQCIACKEYVEKYLRDNGFGIRLHPAKTYYAPISRGFTFCGWRYTIDENGKVHVRIKNAKKKDMERRLKIISEEVRKGKMPREKALQIQKGMFNYLSHGTESKKLIKYMKRMYPI